MSYPQAPSGPGGQTFRFRRQFFTLFGGKFRVFDANNNLVYFSRQKAFKLKEDIRVFSDETESREILHIQARQIIDLGATYDVYDKLMNVKVGALRRKGIKSILRDEWHILDVNDQQIGVIQEDSTGLALLRRLLTNLIPQSFSISLYGQPVAELNQHFNPFVLSHTLDLSRDPNGTFDRRFAVAACILILAIEGRQN